MTYKLEAGLEAKFCRAIDKLGGRAIKLAVHGVRGFPDRTVLMPGGRVSFVELKRPGGGKLSKQQEQWARVLRGLGFEVGVIDSEEQLADYVSTLTERSNAKRV